MAVGKELCRVKLTGKDLVERWDSHQVCFRSKITTFPLLNDLDADAAKVLGSIVPNKVRTSIIWLNSSQHRELSTAYIKVRYFLPF